MRGAKNIRPLIWTTKSPRTSPPRAASNASHPKWYSKAAPSKSTARAHYSPRKVVCSIPIETQTSRANKSSNASATTSVLQKLFGLAKALPATTPTATSTTSRVSWMSKPSSPPSRKIPKTKTTPHCKQTSSACAKPICASSSCQCRRPSFSKTNASPPATPIFPSATKSCFYPPSATPTTLAPKPFCKTASPRAKSSPSTPPT